MILPLSPDDYDSDRRVYPDATEYDLRVAHLHLYIRQALLYIGALADATPDELRAGLPPPLFERLGQALAQATHVCVKTTRLFRKNWRLIQDQKEREIAEAAGREQRRLAVLADLTYIGDRQQPEGHTSIGWGKDGRRVALSRKGGHVILCAGSLGSGKSQTATNIAEGALRIIEGITGAVNPATAVMSFTYVPDGLRLPDLLEALRPNADPADAAFLEQTYYTKVQAIRKMRLVIPDWLLPEYEELLRPYVALGLTVVPLRLRLSQLSMSGIQTLIGGDPDAAYIQVILDKAEELGDKLCIDDLRHIIENAPELGTAQKRLSLSRLRLLEKIASDKHDLWDMVEPGVLTLFVLGGRWIRDNEALPLIVTLMNALTGRSERWGEFQRFFQLDEVNRYESDARVMAHLVTTARQIRHRGSSIMLCGQDLMRLPDELVALSTMLAVFRLNSPAVWEDIKRRRGGFSGIPFADISRLLPGEAFVAVSESTDPRWEQHAQWVKFRPLLCQHGGYTKACI